MEKTSRGHLRRIARGWQRGHGRTLTDEVVVEPLHGVRTDGSSTTPWAIFATVENGTPDSRATRFCGMAFTAKQATT